MCRSGGRESPPGVHQLRARGGVTSAGDIRIKHLPGQLCPRQLDLLLSALFHGSSLVCSSAIPKKAALLVNQLVFANPPGLCSSRGDQPLILHMPGHLRERIGGVRPGPLQLTLRRHHVRRKAFWSDWFDFLALCLQGLGLQVSSCRGHAPFLVVIRVLGLKRLLD